MRKISKNPYFLTSLLSNNFKIIIIIAILITSFTTSQESENFNEELSQKIIISLRPMEKSYHLNSPITFQFTVHNLFLESNFNFNHFPNSFIQFELTIREKNYQNPYNTISWDAYQYNRDSSNLTLINKKNSKRVSLGFQESFSGAIDVNDFFEFTKPGDYLVEGFFYPLGNLTNPNQQYKIAIKPFQFTLKNPLFNSLHDKTLLNENKEQNTLPSSTSFNKMLDRFPRALMEKHILSLKEKNWENYLATLDLPALLKNSYNNTIFYERYVGALAEEKIHILEDFKYFLLQDVTYEIDEDMILKTIIDKNELGEVEVYYSLRDAFENPGTILNKTTDQQEEAWIKEDEKKFIKNYVYTYSLKNDNNGWKITAIDVRIAKTPPNEINQTPTPLQSVEELNRLELLGSVLFPSGIDAISPEYFEFLDNLILYLKANPFYKVHLEGNADNIGEAADNLDLSRRRGLSVYQYLVNNGVEAIRVSYSFNGDTKPITANSTEAERSLNRRVEVFLFQ